VCVCECVYVFIYLPQVCKQIRVDVRSLHQTLNSVSVCLCLLRDKTLNMYMDSVICVGYIMCNATRKLVLYYVCYKLCVQSATSFQ